MGLVAKLVTLTVTTRVIVDESLTDDQIIDDCAVKLVEKAQHEFRENIDSIVDDTECPYTSELDD